MPSLRAAELELHWEEEGAGDPLLLLPGLGADHHEFDFVRAELAKRHRLVLIDPRDTGASGEAAAPYGLADVALDALRVADELGLGRFAVLGACMGGAVAQHLALQAPDRVAAMVLVATWPRTDAFLRTVLESWRAQASRLGTEAFPSGQAAWLHAPRVLAAPPPEIAAAWRVVRERGWPRSVPAFERQVDACAAHDALPALVLLQTPTLVLVGEEDILTAPRYSRALAARLGRAEVVLLPGVAHAALAEDPKGVAERALRFLARHPAASERAA